MTKKVKGRTASQQTRYLAIKCKLGPLTWKEMTRNCSADRGEKTQWKNYTRHFMGRHGR